MAAALRVADVIRSCWKEYNRATRLPREVVKAVRHILSCRTAVLGGHLYECDHCGSQVPVYNSCQDRHCPTCQTSAREKWLSKRRAELLPVRYFHCVFTLPHALNALIVANRRLLLGELFGVVNWVLQAFARDPRWRLQGELGYLAVLHTWTQRLQRHFHLHCIVPGGVWRADSAEWIPCRGRWLFRKDSLADAFRNRFLKRLVALRRGGKLRFSGQAALLADPIAWQRLMAELAAVRWMVYPKAAPADPQTVLDYLGRYTHRVAISDYRLVGFEQGIVTYTWQDRSENNTQKLDRLPAEEFTRRFCYHILPPRFRKIRYFGWLSAPKRKTALAAIRAALHASAPEPDPPLSLAERILQRTGIDVTRCPHCGQGHLRNTGMAIRPQRGPP